MNVVMLIGRLTKDIDLRYSDSGTAIARFTLAVDRFNKNKKDTDFPNITAFGTQAENASKYLHKGSKCGVQGSIKTGSYEKSDGTKVYTTEVFVDRIEFLDSKEDSKQGFQPVEQPEQGRFEQQFGQEQQYEQQPEQGRFEQQYGQQEQFGQMEQQLGQMGFRPVDDEGIPF